jgi:hypothetical protein
MPVEAPLSAIEYPPALPEVETVKDKADAGPAYRAR